MTAPSNAVVQWVHRERVTNGSAYNGTQWTQDAPVSIAAVFAPGGSIETTQANDQVVTKPTLYIPDEYPIAATDQFIVNGCTFEVDGAVSVWPPSPYATSWRSPTPVEVQLKEVTG